jgi:hypothetical protein
MRQQLAHWHAVSKCIAGPIVEATKFASERTELVFGELIAGEDINYMSAISIKWANFELVPEQVEVTGP